MAESRETILEKASGLFLARGYGAVGTAEICRVAGVNKGTLYHFYPTKLDLLLAAIDRYAEAFRDDFRAIAVSGRPAPEKLKALFGVTARANQDWKERNGHAQGCLVGNSVLELGASEEAVRAHAEAAFTSWEREIAPVIEELQANGQLEGLDPQRGAAAVIALMQGGLVLAKSRNDPSEISRLAGAAIGALTALQSD
ncbi:TetR/AcrR family transcriptional regulator [Nisaea acidiphila]|uniref:TetR/AcrR family transcriptional regulator n=1 Tax=Nisaea acidiphila TaxID=1862145 RepID=A0A9J7AVT3_9PROT|nr:TetR/AcrR family transcriptional regulator [Nisaea acidiphila]UUX50914.1 TetR/AcrR family transcriptional regulator [Nisaea acidiphila]